MGSAVRQRKVVRPPRVVRPAGSPFDTASSPFGTVTEMSYDALSDGWWLPGNHTMDPAGSPRASAPVSVGSQPSLDPSGSVRVCGVPE